MKSGLLLSPAAGAATGLALVCAALVIPSSFVRGQAHIKLLKYDSDVRPILAENCFPCHGPDPTKRFAGLRLDMGEVAERKLPSSRTAIVPGKPGESELLERITSVGPLHMPPLDSNKKLHPGDLEILRAWIQQGAKYEPHWAYIPPVRPTVPIVHNSRWAHNAIDRFVLARLESEGLQPSAAADRRTLIRRVTLDLTGLPPQPRDIDAFLNDHSPSAYEHVVDRLLGAPAYGERMAVPWLDLARYADTHGYHIDSERTMWRWREWVINAFNSNMPYNQFTTEQLAGDLLPHPSMDQRIATGFNRNNPVDFEGGAIPEEYAAQYIEDRIDATSTTFMGLTMRCAQCHDHKFDPITQKDYYSFFALFNDIPELGLDGQKGNAVPYIKAPSPDQQKLVDSYTVQAADLDSKLRTREAAAPSGEQAWEQTASAAMDASPALASGLIVHYPLNESTGSQAHSALVGLAACEIVGAPTWGPGRAGTALKLDGKTYARLPQQIAFDRTSSFSFGAWVNPESTSAMSVVSRMDDTQSFRGWDLYLSGGKAFMHLIHTWDSDAIRVNTKADIPVKQWTHIFVTYNGSGKAAGVHIYLNGKVADLDITHDTLKGSILNAEPVLIGRRNPSSPYMGSLAEVRVYGREVTPSDVQSIYQADSLRAELMTSASKRTTAMQTDLVRYYLKSTDTGYAALTASREKLSADQAALDAQIPTAMVFQHMDKQRQTHMLERGQYDKLGAVVTANTPEFLPKLPTWTLINRLAMARWLVNPKHPLTARVAVNRYWQMLFGQGLVRTPENFGTQGERPTHPQLLDWLATEFMRTGWNVKQMIKMIVMSATYQQSTKATPAMIARDPEDKLLERAPRFRLAAEFIHDQALDVSGLLVHKLGGPSVHPYQPPGLWRDISFGGGFSAQYYVQDHGEALYRRGLYTFWKRTCPPPALQVFDAPEREYCVVQRSVTDTPLQALVLMNDPTYTEAARKMAERVLHEAPANDIARIRYAFLLLTARYPNTVEAGILQGILVRQTARFTLQPKAAAALLAVGESPRDAHFPPQVLAAWATVCSVMMNMDEAITRS